MNNDESNDSAPIEKSLIGVVFPGQGSQSPGMLADYGAHEPIFRKTFDEASEALNKDLWQLIAQAQAEELSETVVTQTVMLTANVAIWRVWQSYRALTLVAEMSSVIACAGHSLGECSALVAAGCVDFVDMLAVVERRACLMQAAVPKGQGGMAAIIGLELALLETVCEEAAKQMRAVVSIANLNAPGQTVIGGHLSAIRCAMDLAKKAGAKRAVLLPMSVPSHCELMQDAANEFRLILDDLVVRPPSCSVVTNVDAVAVWDPAQLKDALYRQLYSPVRWVACMQTMAEMGVTEWVECGPGRVLSGLNKRILPDVKLTALEKRETLLSFEC